ncbi:phage major capsid protein [Rhodococcus qingshengii]|uniref:phage major capsid protein n=1 Tax=Rhodococcus qingshengii TaxID=334542 RepID=UPI0035DF74DC
MIDEKMAPLLGVDGTPSRVFTKIAESHTVRRSGVKRVAYDSLRKLRGPMGLITLMKEAAGGHPVAMGKLREAVTSGDFPLLFQAVSQASMLGKYAELPQQWPTFSTRTTVPDFRAARIIRWDTASRQLPDYNGGADRHVRALPRIPELTEYPTFNLTTEGTDYFVNKYGARFPFSWEAFLNDELRVLQELPVEMARWARDTEDIITTGVLATASGPNPDFFNTTEDFGTHSPNGNYVENNPPLSLKALENAIQQIGTRQVDGRQVRVQNYVLLVPPSLALTAHSIAQSTTYVHVQRVATDEEYRTNVSSPVAGRFTVVESPWLTEIDQSATAATTWYLVPAGGETERGPSIVTAFLRGHEVPDVRKDGSAGQSLSGGELDGFVGSFIQDDIQYRVRAVVGAAGIDASAVAVSRGDGSATGEGEVPVPPGLMRGPVIPTHETDPDVAPEGDAGGAAVQPFSAVQDAAPQARAAAAEPKTESKTASQSKTTPKK